MLFGICSALEIFPRKMHEMIEGLQGVKVVADNFLVFGRGVIRGGQQGPWQEPRCIITMVYWKGCQTKYQQTPVEINWGPISWAQSNKWGSMCGPCKSASYIRMAVPVSTSSSMAAWIGAISQQVFPTFSRYLTTSVNIDTERHRLGVGGSSAESIWDTKNCHK